MKQNFDIYDPIFLNDTKLGSFFMLFMSSFEYLLIFVGIENSFKFIEKLIQNTTLTCLPLKFFIQKSESVILMDILFHKMVQQFCLGGLVVMGRLPQQQHQR